MTDILNKTVGAAALDLSFSAGKLSFTVGDPSLGVSGVVSVDGVALVAALQALLDGKFPNEKAAIDLVMGLVSSAIQSA
jgi:hypothetical protein